MTEVSVPYGRPAHAARLFTSRCLPLAALAVLALPARAQTTTEIPPEGSTLPQAPSALLASALPAPPDWVTASSSSQPSEQAPQQTPAQAPAVQLPAAPTEAQRPGMGLIGGIVTDIQGALVPGAKVDLEEKATKARRSTTAASDGEFAFPNVAPGDYVIYIQAPGLSNFVSPAIVLKAGQSYQLPNIALPVSAEQTVDVFFTQKEIAQQELHAEEKQRVLGVIPNFYTSYLWDAAPLDAAQKFQLSAHSSLDPVGLSIVFIRAGIQQARDTYPSLDDGPAGYGERAAIDFGNHVIGSTIGRALMPAIFHEDPRYFYMGPGSSGRQRTLHALGSSFICRHDRTTRDGFCYSHVIGLFAAGAISNSYTPGRSIVNHTLTEWGIGLAGTSAANVLREFLIKAIASHVPKYGKGKSKDEPDTHSLSGRPEGKPKEN